MGDDSMGYRERPKVIDVMQINLCRSENGHSNQMGGSWDKAVKTFTCLVRISTV